jgi:hypothetical protein
MKALEAEGGRHGVDPSGKDEIDNANRLIVGERAPVDQGMDDLRNHVVSRRLLDCSNLIPEEYSYRRRAPSALLHGGPAMKIVSPSHDVVEGVQR